MAQVLDPHMLRCTAALLGAHIALDRRIECDAVEPTGLDATIVDLLVRLDQAPDNRLRAVELSRQLMLSPSHISRMLDRAEAAGLVRRGPDPDDRRAAQVELTPAGAGAVADFAPRLERVIGDVILAQFSPSEIDTLVELLGRIEQAASATSH